MNKQASRVWRGAGRVMCLCLATLPVYAQGGKRIFVSPRHSQVSMTGAWEPELLRDGKKRPRCHWISSSKGDALSLRFEGTSVALATRTGVRTSWLNPTHTNSLARLGRLDVRLDGKSLPTIDLSGSAGVPAYELPIASGLVEGLHVLELSNAGVGAVDVAGFMLDRPLYNRLAETGGDMTRQPGILQAADRLAAECLAMGCAVVLVKCGLSGMVYRTGNRERAARIGKNLSLDPEVWAEQAGIQPCFQAETVCSGTGAGDVSIAAYLTALLNGETPEICARLAAAEGAASVASYDALGGILPLAELKRRIENGWKTMEDL